MIYDEDFEFVALDKNILHINFIIIIFLFISIIFYYFFIERVITAILFLSQSN